MSTATRWRATSKATPHTRSISTPRATTAACASPWSCTAAADAARTPTVPEFGPYQTPGALRRDELWRCWLGVEYQIRQRWALGALPEPADDGKTAGWAPENVAGVF